MEVRWKGTYGCLLAAGQRCCPAAGFAVRRDLIERSRVRQNAPGAAAWPHEGWNTFCDATGVECASGGLVGRIAE